MKVLVLFSSTHIGGAEKSLLRMILAADQTVKYVVGNFVGFGKNIDEYKQHKVSTYFVKGLNGNGYIDRIRVICQIADDIKEKRYNVIYVLGIRGAAIVRILSALLGECNIVQGIRWDVSDNSVKGKIFLITEMVLQRYTRLYICNSVVSARWLINKVGIGQHKIDVIYNGITPKQIDSLNTIRRFDIVSVGNFTQEKGYQNFIKFVVLPIAKKYPHIKFGIVGRSDASGKCQELVRDLGLADNLTFTGFVDDVSSVLKSSEIFVLPSISEGCPTSIIEAMADGLPVVAFAVGGIPEIVDHGVTGFLVDPLNYLGMTNAIENLINDKCMAKHLGRSGREKCMKQMDIKICASQHAESFSKVIN